MCFSTTFKRIWLNCASSLIYALVDRCLDSRCLKHNTYSRMVTSNCEVTAHFFTSPVLPKLLSISTYSVVVQLTCSLCLWIYNSRRSYVCWSSEFLSECNCKIPASQLTPWDLLLYFLRYVVHSPVKRSSKFSPDVQLPPVTVHS